MLTCSACSGLTPRDTSTTCLHCDVPLRAPRLAKKLACLLGPAGAILLAACYGAPGRYYARDQPQPVDMDRDGSPSRYEECYGRCLAPGPQPGVLDCDDADPARYPGAADSEGDGIDQNCDGVDGWRDPNVGAQPASVATDPVAP